ncbi:hypothetical protein GUJ93_ZPchr0010g10431 [Zizania palustris]|uniref:Uncharacterized protein n=1 Tax=Zizania palustris TaxID=103762 RepID=A0A8J6BK38_ZIZPA|nr:hypothetical protein GUJ93_ZPchr0010g10431 [Zizania palustris]
MDRTDVDGDLSSMTSWHSSGSGGGCSAVSEESGWTSYIDYFMETQQQQQREEKKEAAAAARADSATDDIGRRPRSSSSGDDRAAQPPLLERLVEPSEASRRSVSFVRKEGRRRKKLLMYDESLEDTATSRIISSPKQLIDSRDSYDNVVQAQQQRKQ